jgi:hypothetical protein
LARIISRMRRRATLDRHSACSFDAITSLSVQPPRTRTAEVKDKAGASETGFEEMNEGRGEVRSGRTLVLVHLVVEDPPLLLGLLCPLLSLPAIRGRVGQDFMRLRSYLSCHP